MRSHGGVLGDLPPTATADTGVTEPQPHYSPVSVPRATPRPCRTRKRSRTPRTESPTLTPSTGSTDSLISAAVGNFNTAVGNLMHAMKDEQTSKRNKSDSCDSYTNSLRLIETKHKIKNKIREMEAEYLDDSDEDDLVLLKQHLTSIKNKIRTQII